MSGVLRKELAKQFIESVILNQYRQLVAWQTVTGQSSQIDSGYLAQQLVSIITGIPGRGEGSRGKGIDLQDGSEVKAASTLSGKDIPRWNNILKSKTKVDQYLSTPFIYFILFDTVNKNEPFPFRTRLWRVSPSNDKHFQGVVKTWSKLNSSGNFQLHPPCWKNGNVVTNKSGNLEFPLIFHAVQRDVGEIDFVDILVYNFSNKKCNLV